MTDYIRPASQRHEVIGGEGPTRAEAHADALDDHYGAQRDAALAALRAELVAVQAQVLAAHGSVANLCDVNDYLPYAVDALDSEAQP